MGFLCSKKVKWTRSLYLYLMWLKSYGWIPFRWQPYWIWPPSWSQGPLARAPWLNHFSIPSATSVPNFVLVDEFTICRQLSPSFFFHWEKNTEDMTSVSSMVVTALGVSLLCISSSIWPVSTWHQYIADVCNEIPHNISLVAFYISAE